MWITHGVEASNQADFCYVQDSSTADGEALMNKIFISYRRDDSQLSCDRIYGFLGPVFSVREVFRDLNAIRGGVDFRAEIDRGLRHCQVVLVVIGPRWTTITDATGLRRLDDPNDYVRVEVETALSLNVPIIPLLVQGATPPQAAELPLALKPLAFRNTRVVRADPDFARDMQLVMQDIAQVVPIPRRHPGLFAARNATRQVASFVVGLISFLLLVATLSTWITIPFVTHFVDRLLNH
jgi:TIR domain